MLVAFLGLACIPLFLGSLVALGIQFIRKKSMKVPGICLLASLVIFLICVSIPIDASEESVSNETTLEQETSKEELTTVEETTTAEITTQEETTIQPETEETTTEEETTVAETESEDEFKSSCQEIGYKKLLRTPDEYVGQRIVITAEVQQVIDGGLFDDSKYYRVQTDNNDSGYYFDDEYFMYDNRVNDDMKILDGDVLKIYGEFTGLETMKRVITGSKDEVPAIKAYYVELISE